MSKKIRTKLLTLLPTFHKFLRILTRTYLELFTIGSNVNRSRCRLLVDVLEAVVVVIVEIVVNNNNNHSTLVW